MHPGKLPHVVFREGARHGGTDGSESGIIHQGDFLPRLTDGRGNDEKGGGENALHGNLLGIRVNPVS